MLFIKGKKLLSSIELTAKQKNNLALASAASSPAIRTAFVAYALLSENGVIAKLLAKNENNENIDPELVEVACKIAKNFSEA